MTAEKFRTLIKTQNYIESGSKLHKAFHEFSQRAMKITCDMNYTLIGHNVVIATINHDLSPEKRASMILSPVHIGKNVWIGSNSTILPGVTIGDGAVIGAGSVVTKNVPENTVFAGIPAKKIKEIDAGETYE